MDIKILMVYSTGNRAMREVKAYELGESGAAVHRDEVNPGFWQVSDIATGSAVGENAQTKKLAIANFHEKYEEKLYEFRKTPRYAELKSILDEKIEAERQYIASVEGDDDE